MSLSTENTCYVGVLNNFAGNAIISFSHQYTGEGVQIYSGTQVAPGQATGLLTVNFWTGMFSTGTDSWYCQAQVLSGPFAGRTFQTEGSLNSPGKACMCRAADNGITYYFPFSPSGMVMPLLSGPCQTGIA